jgi:polysaccharide export outer membrane protein
MLIKVKNLVKKPFNSLDSRLFLMMAFLILAPMQSANAADSIGPDDALRISVYGYNDLSTETRVSADGKITFPLVGEVLAAGKSSIDLEEEISKRLMKGGYIQNAQVTVKITEHVSQQISVLGYVSKPGRYTLGSESTIVDLIAMAGGINEQGSNKVILVRSDEGKLVKQIIDLKHYMEDMDNDIKPITMERNDFVYVPKAPLFYIYGEVLRPGSYRLESGISVLKALSIGGGLTLRGTENGIIIKRMNKAGVLEEIDVELGDAVLKDDVIYVSERWF